MENEKNSFVLKLRAVVADDDLDILSEGGVLKLRVRGVDDEIAAGSKRCYVGVAFSEDVHIWAEGGGRFAVWTGLTMGEYVSEADVPSSVTRLSVENRDFVLCISDSSAVTLLTVDTSDGDILWGCKLAELASCVGMTQLSLPLTSSRGDVGSLSGLSGLTGLNISGIGATGDIEFLKGKSSLTLAHLYNNSGIEGTLGSVGRLPALTDLHVSNTMVEVNIDEDLAQFPALERFYATGVKSFYGSVEGLVSSLSGRSCPTNGLYIIALLRTGAGVTFGGKTRPNVPANQWLFWEGSGQSVKIAVLCGAGTQVSQTTHIYYKGYSASEINTKWPGRQTLIDVSAV